METRNKKQKRMEVIASAIPNDVLFLVLGLIAPEQLIHLNLVSKQFYTIITSKRIWKQKCHRHFPARTIEAVRKMAASNIDINYFNFFKAMHNLQEKHIANKRVTLMHSLAKEGDRKEFLILKPTLDEMLNCDIEGKTIMDYAQAQGKQFILDYYYKAYKRSSIHPRQNNIDTIGDLIYESITCWQSNEEISRLIKLDGEINLPVYFNLDPLALAAKSGCIRIVALLISLGANINGHENGEFSPLHQAAVAGHTPVVATLLAAGARVDTRGIQHRTALHEAMLRGFVDMVKLLLQHGADVNATTTMHETPLFLAAKNDLADAVRLLFQYGANPGIANSENLTPYDIAHQLDHQNMLELLAPYYKNKPGKAPEFVEMGRFRK